MRVERFVDQYAATAPLYGLTADDLRRRDERQPWPRNRWIAVEDGRVIGAVTTLQRPDDRLFLNFAGDDTTTIGALTDAVAAEARTPLHTSVDDADTARLDALRSAGFVTEAVSDSFRVGFERAIHGVRRVALPPGFAIRSAADADEGRLFALDNMLRQDVPGTDGWRGDRALFHDELTGALIS